MWVMASKLDSMALDTFIVLRPFLFSPDLPRINKFLVHQCYGMPVWNYCFMIRVDVELCQRSPSSVALKDDGASFSDDKTLAQASSCDLIITNIRGL